MSIFLVIHDYCYFNFYYYCCFHYYYYHDTLKSVIAFIYKMFYIYSYIFNVSFSDIYITFILHFTCIYYVIYIYMHIIYLYYIH